MSWVKIDDQFPTHPKVVAAGGDAAWLHVCALCYCAQHLTDGFVPKAMLDRISDRKNARKLADRLVEVGMWIDRGDEIEIHGYLDYNPSRESVEKVRSEARERRAKGGKRSADVRANATNPDPTRTRPVPDVPTEHQEIAPARRPRERDPLWDALIECWCISEAELTDVERGRLNKAAKSLRDVRADPSEIPRRRARYRRRYPDAADTPMAVAGRWSELRQDENGSTPKMPAGTEHTQRNLERMLADGRS